MTMNIEPINTMGTEADNVIAQINGNARSIQTDALTVLNRGDDLVAKALLAIKGIADSLIDIPAGAVPGAPTIAAPPSAPTFEVTANPIESPSTKPVPELDASVDIYQPKDVVVPDAPIGNPDVVIPPMPSVAMPSAPQKPDVDLSVDLPPVPTLELPTAPLIAGITLPDLPVLDIPKMDAVDLPVWDTATPILPDIIQPVSIDDALLQAFAALAQDTTPKTIDAAYTSDLRRQEDEIDRRLQIDIEAAFSDFASRGFIAPLGALTYRIDMLRDTATGKLKTISRDLALARLNTELDVYKANLSAGVELARLQIDNQIQVYRLQLDMAIAHARSTVDLYNALVDVFKAKQMAAQITVEVYKAQLQAEMSKVDIYAKQVDAQKTVVEASVAQMQGYEAQVRGILAAVDIYKAQVEGAKLQLEAQSEQLTVFRAEVDAYAAEVTAAKAVYEAYEAQVRSAVAPVQVYEATMRGYAAKVDGVKAQADIEQSKVEASARAANAKIDVFRANVDAIVKDGDLKIETVKANAEIERTRLSAAETQARSLIANYQAMIEAYRTQSTLAVSNYEAAIKAFQVQGEFNQQRAALHVEAARGAAQVSAQLASSALAGLNIHESLSSSTSLQAGVNASSQWNYAYGESHSFQGE